MRAWVRGVEGFEFLHNAHASQLALTRSGSSGYMWGIATAAAEKQSTAWCPPVHVFKPAQSALNCRGRTVQQSSASSCCSNNAGFIISAKNELYVVLYAAQAGRQHVPPHKPSCPLTDTGAVRDAVHEQLSVCALSVDHVQPCTATATQAEGEWHGCSTHAPMQLVCCRRGPHLGHRSEQACMCVCIGRRHLMLMPMAP